ncbi:MAG TPA: hypothetical protein VGK77_20950 [Candidatus Binatia bacterium]|jgi:tRNA A37 N6-isopentenylltransferase MiaA
METNLREEALLEMLRQAEPELREKYGDDSAVQILDEVLYPIAEKLIEKDALSPEQATANMPAVEATQTKTDRERLEQIIATPTEQMVNEDVLEMIANVLEMCIDELDESTDEERVRILDWALKSMVAVGRWSVLQ